MDYLDIVNEYDKAFSPDSRMKFDEPSGAPIVTDYTGGSGATGRSSSYTMPYDKAPETPEQMMNRIKRSVACGRNLFFEEWVTPLSYEEGCDD